MKNNKDYNPVKKKDLSKGENREKVKENLQMPSLDQFMKLITDEDKALITSPSAYNAYRKYNKGS